MMTSSDKGRRTVDSALAGVVAGSFGTLLGFPMDVVKTHMQTRARGIVGTVQDIARRDGVRGFYRGVAAPMAALTVLNAQTFALYSNFKRLAAAGGLPAAPVAGAMCGPFSALISTPFELLKVRVALGLATSTLDAARTAGLRNLYRGHGVNTLRECVFLGTYFGVYEAGRALDDSAAAVALSGATAGASGWVVSFPLDAIKTKVQRATAASPWRVARTMIAEAGSLAAFYRGVGPSVVRACVVSASRFSAFEAALALLQPRS
ncbi:hypothetical protein CTAYLR_005494 [Chrysophaeum taylorii]|uniref:Mitochondrial carrier protein n=1 Tax=Chrysophaeum taylorii TaxID=2483200 RepID=A0AAD7XHD9_9STRA|nr:hypothetical protein CTAYLR_005494 [Chrysophaeum taylorii]